MLGKLGCYLVGAATMAAVMTATAEEFDLKPVPENGVVLLRNGQVIEGRISRAGDLYYVALPNGEIRIKAAEVEFCCRDLEEGYVKKRASIQPGDVRDHLRLAQWCLRHELFGRTGKELADALEVEPTHPLIEVLDRRLRLSMQRPMKPSTPAKPIERVPLPDDIDRLARDIPPGSVEVFTQTIQPLLINNCAAASCHGPGTTAEFRLSRFPIGSPPSRTITQQNLQATARWIDRDTPSASRLLTATIQPHATAKTAIFSGPKIAQYERLKGWVYQVAGRPVPSASATSARREDMPMPTMPPESPGFVFPDPAATPIPEQKPAMQPGVENPFGKPFPHHPDVPGAPYVPIDSFDPEIFNRRHLTKRNASPEGVLVNGRSGIRPVL